MHIMFGIRAIVPGVFVRSVTMTCPLWLDTASRHGVLALLVCALLFSLQGMVIGEDAAVILVNSNSGQAVPDDGLISLWEAIESANVGGVPAVIRFSPELAGTVIDVSEQLPSVEASDITVDGDIDGDGTPDITIRNRTGEIKDGITVASGSNVTIRGLHIRDFRGGIIVNGDGGNVLIENNHVEVDATTLPIPPISDVDRRGIEPYGVPTGMTIRNNVVTMPARGNYNGLPFPYASWQSGCTFRVGSWGDTEPGDVARNLEITGNTFRNCEIGFDIRRNSCTIEDATIAKNIVTGQIGLNTGLTPNANPDETPHTQAMRHVRILQNRMSTTDRHLQIMTRGGQGHELSDILIAENDLQDCRGVSVQDQSSGAVLDIRFEGNVLRNCGDGINVQAAAQNPNPVRIDIAGNEISGGNAGISLLNCRDIVTRDNILEFNTGNGISADNCIGEHRANVIRFNGGHGMSVVGAQRCGIVASIIHENGRCGISSRRTANMTISHCSITKNVREGIYFSGVVNGGILPPLLTGADSSSVSGTVTAPDGSLIEIFSDSEDEGETYLGSAVVAGGSFVFTGFIPTSGHVTATVTHPDGNTSIFSTPLSPSVDVGNWFLH
ncbi:MAG TPA: right-handed parallel beta-helix repeat-containing protein [bacterium]|nr:right-handed parallel beta-helix repeat-containing protein [bacterium]